MPETPETKPETTPAPGTKARLLAIALELLREHGIGGLTIRKISERASVSLSIVHHHYVNKQGLIDACKSHYYQDLGTQIASIVQTMQGRPLEESVSVAVRLLFQHSRQHKQLVKVLASQVISDGELVAQYRDYEKRPYLGQAITLLAPKMNLPNQTARARVHAMGVLVTRFAISSTEELEAILGPGDECVFIRAEEELVQMANVMLFSQSATS